MPDFVLQDDQNVDCAVQVTDDAGNIVPGVTFDAGSVTATASDTTILETTVSPDGSSVNVKALGPEGTGVTVTVDGSIAGAALNPGSLAFDVTNSPPANVGLVPGTPQHN